MAKTTARSAVAKKIVASAGDINTGILKRKKPSIKIPIRSLSNVRYTPKAGYFQLKGNKKTRTLTVNTVKSFAQTLRLIEFSKELIDTDNIATKREAYYVSKNWDVARFKEQPESDAVMDDIEAMYEVNREQLGFIPDEKSGAVAGRLIVIDKEQGSGKTLKIDCSRFGSGAYSIPSSVEDLKFETSAKFILAIETNGAFQRLVKQDFWRAANCIIIAMGGVPTRACRRFIRRLADMHKLPVYVFCDCDPYGYCNIYRTLKVGSGNAGHINRYFCVPHAHYLGVTMDDIEKYDLPTHPLQDIDKKRARDALKNDPFVKHYKAWQAELEKMIKAGVRAEQQAFAKHSLPYVAEKYLPEKLKHPEKFLP
ncbi:MAG: DNA topoisomerase IV subunit A [Planctomycetota bacterium]